MTLPPLLSGPLIRARFSGRVPACRADLVKCSKARQIFAVLRSTFPFDRVASVSGQAIPLTLTTHRRLA